MATMTLGTLSICMTVIILNVHHRGASQRIPAWLRRAAFVYLARLICVKTPYTHDPDYNDAQRQQASSSSAAVTVQVSPLASPIEPIWKRRSDAKPPSPPRPDIPRSCVGRRDRLEMSLMRMFRRSERSSNTLATCNGCAFVAAATADNNALTSVPPRRRRSRLNGESQTRTGNGRQSIPTLSTDSPATRDEVLSPLLKTPRRMSAARRYSTAAVARRIDVAAQCRSDAAWSTMDSGDISGQCPDVDDEVERAERYANEWRELARILDRLCFWILLVLMTASGFIILLYPKYTGSESDWGIGIT